jgi:7-carboxy-7-deazaguanine synthase
VDQKMIDQHNKFRLNKEAMAQMMTYHGDYHFKPVWDGTEENLNEIESFRVEMDIPKWKTWLMPAGDTRETLIHMYPISIEKCMEMGYNWTGRDHIIAYDTKRAV